MFNLDEYTTVRERILLFWEKYPNGRIRTEILDWSDKRFIVLAEIYADKSDTFPLSTGLANEIVGSSNVNRDFALENCATSALGIAAGNAGIGIDKQKASRDEMVKVVTKSVTKPAPQDIKEGDPDYWTTPVGQHQKTTQAPVTLEKAIETVTAILGTGEASESPQCTHGHMKWREGDKAGKAWGGFFCTVQSQTGGSPKCPTLWYVLSPSGQWEPQKPRG